MPLSDHYPRMNFLLCATTLQPSGEIENILKSRVPKTKEVTECSVFMVQTISKFNCIHDPGTNISKQYSGNESSTPFSTKKEQLLKACIIIYAMSDF